MLAFGAVVAASAGAGGVVAELHKKTASTITSAINTAAAKLPTVFKRATPLPVDPALSISGLSPLVTATKDFFRIDTAFSVPEISVDTWKLKVDGLVAQPALFTYADLLAMPMMEIDCTIGCVSDTVGGDLVGNARWLGVKLDHILNQVHPQKTADQILSFSSDGFSAGFPVEAAYDRDAIVAIAMNGEVLTREHGFPARLIVPGLYGYVSATKWLSNINLTRFDQKQGFWISRGWSQLGPIKTESRIDNFKQGQRISAKPTHIAGVAWAPTKGITKVEVQIDNEPWQSATLGPQISKASWRQWWIDWTPTPGLHRMTVRATDGSGYTQSPKTATPAPNGASGWHSLSVNVA